MSKIRSFLMCIFCLAPFLALANYSGAYTITEPVSGDGATVWEYNTGSDTVIQVRTQSGGVWAAPVTLTDPLICMGSKNPKVAINSSGDLVVAWLGLDPVTYVTGVYGSFYVSGVWTAPVLVSDPIDYVISDFSLNIDSTGTVQVVWTSYLTDVYLIAVRAVYSSTFGTWGIVQTLGS